MKPASNDNGTGSITTRKLGAARAIIILTVFAVMYLCSNSINSFFKSATRVGMQRTCRRPMSNTVSIPGRYKLPSGDMIPAVALGVWQASPGEVGQAVKAALKAGYRHIDGAWIYRNEPEVGKAIKESGVPRKEIWLTSKLWNNFHAPEDVESALDQTLAALGSDYLDMYLMHWPVAFKKEPGPNGQNIVDFALTADPLPTWRALEALVAKGKLRNIGVSNFNARRLANLTANALRVKPAVNQVELNFWNPQPDLVRWAQEHGVILEAYSPLGSNRQVGASLDVPEVKEIASEMCITPAQVLISWQAQRGTIVLPKSVTPSRIQENLLLTPLPFDLFDKLEKAATAHPPQRVVDPSKAWGVDIFEDEK